MTQSQVKQPVTLVSVDRSRSTRAPAGVRVADGDPDAGGVVHTRAAADDHVGGSGAPGDGFVFEEAGLPAPSPTVREVTRTSVRPGTELTRSARVPAADSVAEPSVVALVTAPSQKASTPSAASEPAATTSVAKAEEASTADRSPSVSPPNSEASRRDLELRTQLHRKDEELLAQRTEINARDRKLLELNTRLLEFERARTDLADRMGEQAVLLRAAGDQIRAMEAEKEANAKRMVEIKTLFRRSEDSLKRKSENDLVLLRTAHGAELADVTAAHATKLEQLNAAHATELARLSAARTASEEEMTAKHSAATKAAESAATLSLSNAISSYSRKVRGLQEAQDLALSRTTAAHATALEAARAVVAADKESALADAESTLRTTQNELSELQTTLQFLERGHATQADRIVQLQSTVAALEERLRRADERLEADADMLGRVRQALGAGLSLLNAPRSEPDRN